MSRYFLHFAFNGKNYHGWQFQKNTTQTLQQIMQEKLSLLLHEKIELLGCGRTDTGVHAKEFYAHFNSEKNDLPDETQQWLFKMNHCLPRDIAIKAILPVEENANARFSAFARTYIYYIHRKPDPFLNDFSWYLYGALDIDQMNLAAEIIAQTSDFTSFAKGHNNHKNYICKMEHCKWEKEGDRFILTIKANRFLRNMVRALVGTMVDAGSGKINIEEFREIVRSGSRNKAGFSAPALGLHLAKVEYPKSIFK